MILAVILISVVAAILGLTVVLELKRDLMMLQQNSYRTGRYRRWLSESGDTTSWPRLAMIAIFMLSLSTLSHPYISAALMALCGLTVSVRLLQARYKKPLVWTARARRIYAAALVIAAGAGTGLVFILSHTDALLTLSGVCTALTGCYCASHIITMAAVTVLTPVESAINRRYYNDARRRLRSMPGLRVIGITGSYGKTSTKHYLHRILSEQFDTLMTPGSFNTTLGVIRTVREHLKPYNEVFICEMGAKNIGDVREICELVRPSMGIITAVGPQHLESFGTIENVQRAKFELADALPADGCAIVNDDFEYIADRPVDNTACCRYGISAVGAEWRAEDIRYTAHGTTFTVTGPEGRRLPLSTRLMGECNVSDLLAAVVCAIRLGVPDAKIAAAVASIEPVEHRLTVKDVPGGLTILDDAFNSNPVGSRMALEVLGTFTGGKRIVITPGMIELGSQQEELNREFGRHIAANADVAIVVGRYNRQAITEGIAEGGMDPKAVHTVDTFNQAQEILRSIAAAGDTVLYENDLPDTFK